MELFALDFVIITKYYNHYFVIISTKIEYLKNVYSHIKTMNMVEVGCYVLSYHIMATILLLLSIWKKYAIFKPLGDI